MGLCLLKEVGLIFASVEGIQYQVQWKNVVDTGFFDESIPYALISAPWEDHSDWAVESDNRT